MRTSSASSTVTFLDVLAIFAFVLIYFVFALVDADERRYFSSTHAGKTEIIEEEKERQQREGLIKRVDDWFSLLAVPPGKTFYLPPGIAKIYYFILFFQFSAFLLTHKRSAR